MAAERSIGSLAQALGDAVREGCYARAAALAEAYSRAVERAAADLDPGAAAELAAQAREHLERVRALACAGAAQTRAALGRTGPAQAYAAAAPRPPACDCRG